MHVTTILLDPMTSFYPPAGWAWAVIGAVPDYGPNGATHDTEVSDLTVDLNVHNQTVANAGTGFCAAAVSIAAGDNTKISRVKVLNWGSTVSGAENFLLNIQAHPNWGQVARNCVIEDCIIGNAAPVAHKDGVSAINIMGSLNTGGTAGVAGWIEGGEIRNCFVKDVECAIGGGVGKPTYFHAFGCSGIGMKVRNNTAINLGPAGFDATGSYMECGSYIDYVIENNTFLNVASGIYLQGYGACSTDTALHRKNFHFLNNVITVKSGGVGISFGGYAGGTIGANKPSGVHVANNSISGVVGSSSITGVHFSEIDNLTIQDNTLNANGGNEISMVGGNTVTVASMANNKRSNGSAPTVSGGYVLVSGFVAAEELQEIVFTPVSGQTGWYRLIGGNHQFSGGEVQISAGYDNAFTDLAFDYTVRGYSAPPVCYGEINLRRYQPYNLGVVNYVRIGTDGGAAVYLDVFVGYATAPGPITVRHRGKQGAPMLTPPTYLGNPGTAPAAYRTLYVATGFATSEGIYAGESLQVKGTLTAGSANTVLTDSTGKILGSALAGVTTPFTLGLLDDTDSAAARSTLGFPSAPTSGSILVGNGTYWGAMTPGAAGKALVSSGATVSWGDALQETAEFNSTPVTDTTSTAVGATTLRLFDFITLPTSEKLYEITGIEWKNGATVAGNTICGAVIVNATPPTQSAVPTVAFGQLTANAGANAIQRVSRIVSQPIRGGTMIGIFVQADAATHTYRTATVASANNRKTVTFPASGDVPNQESVAWTAHTTKAYVKVYYRGYK